MCLFFRYHAFKAVIVGVFCSLASANIEAQEILNNDFIEVKTDVLSMRIAQRFSDQSELFKVNVKTNYLLAQTDTPDIDFGDYVDDESIEFELEYQPEIDTLEEGVKPVEELETEQSEPVNGSEATQSIQEPVEPSSGDNLADDKQESQKGVNEPADVNKTTEELSDKPEVVPDLNDDLPSQSDSESTDEEPSELAVESAPDTEEVLQFEDVEVFGAPLRVITPLPGVDFDKSQITTNIQTATGEDIQESQAITATQFMNERLQSVTVNDYTGNPFRQDVNFRGFTASPLAATPQGLSVYVDGVRVNEAFGEVVNWDLIPLNAVDSLALVPGANPLFGLNTLGGAVSLQTKSGFTAEGIDAQAVAGSWGRNRVNVSAGYNNGPMAVYGAFNGVNEDGWRNNSPSRVRQLFGRFDVRGELGQITFSTLYGSNRLVGNGSVPEEDLRIDREQVYTSPDIVNNDLLQFQLTGRLDISPSNKLTAMVYRRDANQNVRGGDFWDDWDGAAPRSTPCDGITPIDGAATGGTGDPDCLPAGLFTDSLLLQDKYGFNLQWNFQTERHQLVAGVTLDVNDTQFSQSERLGWIEADRNVVLDPDRLIDTFIGPRTAQRFHALAALEQDIVRNLLEGGSSNLAFFFLDVWQIHPKVNVSFGARYNRTEVENELQSDLEIPLYQFSPVFLAARDEKCGAPQDGSARFQCTEEEFTYKSFNPAVGVSIQPLEDINIFANISKGNRTPSAIELSCARSGEDDPQTGKFEGCTIPTALTNDPFLPQVRAVNKEVGIRGINDSGIEWNAAFFRTDLKDDILFTSLGFANRGVFDTFGKTRRQGVEMGLNKPQGRFRWFANYTFLEATFESSDTVVNLSNSSSQRINGQPNIFQIEPGDVIPGIPKNTLRAGFDFDLTSDWTVGFNMVAQGETFVRGNENNEHRPEGNDSDGVFFRNRDYVGNGTIPGFAIVNMNSSFYFNDALSIFMRVENLFDKDHATAGNLGLNAFTESNNGTRAASGFNSNSNDWTHSLFVTPGARRAAWLGLNVKF